jgi:hypothetical protein
VRDRVRESERESERERVREKKRIHMQAGKGTYYYVRAGQRIKYCMWAEKGM